MFNHDTYIKKIYNETASVIMDLCFTKQINEAEMYLLLNILDIIWNDNNHKEFIEILVRWQQGPKITEIDDIIKQTLMSADFTDKQSLCNITIMIQDLLSVQKG